MSVERPYWWPPRVGRHALYRYREHYPGATYADVLWDLTSARAVDADLVAALTCAPRRASGATLYLTGRDRVGVFALEPGRTDYTVVTYLRFSESQRAFLED